MENKNLLTSLVVLVLVAVVVFVYFKNNPTEEYQAVDNAIPATTNTQANTQANTLINNNPQSVKPLTADEKQLLANVPKDSDSKEAREARFVLADTLGILTNKLTLNGCSADPVVTKIKINETLAVTNVGAKETSFGFDKDKIVTIASGQTANVVMAFKNGFGMYGYGCPDQLHLGLVGYIIVIPGTNAN